MTVTSATAKITIISGPDRGKVFEIREEVVRVGAGAENDVTLSDPELADHRVRIMCRNGRYAISTPVAGEVQVDGNVLPAERWVWLPEAARVRLGGRTSFQFAVQSREPGDSAEGDPDAAVLADTQPGAEAATPATRRRARGGGGGAERPKKSSKPEEGGGRQVARFITDQKGDALVKLGDDGQLPELTLHEAAGRKRSRDKRASGESSWLIYAAVGVSVLFSLLLVLIDFDPSPVSSRDRGAARREIARFYEDPGGGPLKPYQIHLRNAAREHARGNRAAELEAYHKVLELLRAENKPATGITGRASGDEELKQLIAILLSR